MIRLFTFLAVPAVLLLSACGGSTNGVTTNMDGTVNVTTSEGTATTSHTVPSDWPSDAPIYAGATVQYSASVNPVDGKAGHALVLMTTDSAATVFAYYASELAAQGWKVDSTMNGGTTMITSATKDARTLSLMAAESEGQTAITIAVGDSTN